MCNNSQKETTIYVIQFQKMHMHHVFVTKVSLFVNLLSIIFTTVWESRSSSNAIFISQLLVVMEFEWHAEICLHDILFWNYQHLNTTNVRGYNHIHVHVWNWQYPQIRSYWITKIVNLSTWMPYFACYWSFPTLRIISDGCYRSVEYFWCKLVIVSRPFFRLDFSLWYLIQNSNLDKIRFLSWKLKIFTKMFTGDICVK